MDLEHLRGGTREPALRLFQSALHEQNYRRRRYCLLYFVAGLLGKEPPCYRQRAGREGRCNTERGELECHGPRYSLKDLVVIFTYRCTESRAKHGGRMRVSLTGMGRAFDFKLLRNKAGRIGRLCETPTPTRVDATCSNATMSPIMSRTKESPGSSTCTLLAVEDGCSI